MTANDINVIKGAGTTRQYRLAPRDQSGETSTLKPGEPVKESLSVRLVTLIEDGDPELGTDVFIGIVAKESTETASAYGTVDVVTMNIGRTVMRGKANTASNMNTTKHLNDILMNNVCFDVSARAFTIDENETNDPNVHGLRIVDGDTVAETLDVIPMVMSSEHEPYI